MRTRSSERVRPGCRLLTRHTGRATRTVCQARGGGRPLPPAGTTAACCSAIRSIFRSSGRSPRSPTRRARGTSGPCPTALTWASRIRDAPEDTPGWSLRWTLTLIDEIARANGALITITGDPEPELLAGLDPGRIAHTHPPDLAEKVLKETGDGNIAWTIVGYPNAGWSRTVFGEPDVERLRKAVAVAVRLDEADPVPAWRDHIAKLAEGARRTARRTAARRPRLPRPGDRPHRGADAGVALAVRIRADRVWASRKWSTCRPRRSTPLRTALLRTAGVPLGSGSHLLPDVRDHGRRNRQAGDR